MSSSPDLTSQILESLSGYDPAEHARALNEMLAGPIKTLSIYRILEIRCAIVARLDPDQPAVAAALALIDGQIALREIAPEEGWR